MFRVVCRTKRWQKTGKKQPDKKKEHYGKAWRHEYRKINGKKTPVLVKKENGKEIVKIPSDGYVKKHMPRGPWDS